jgi:hypothetical protein
MNNVKIVFTQLLMVAIICLLNSCSAGSDLESTNNDTIVFQVGDNDNIDWLLFEHTKKNPYAKVYKFQEQEYDDYGNPHWVDWWIIDDFSKEEYEEMVKYADYFTYYDKVQNNSVKNRKYTWKHIMNK